MVLGIVSPVPFRPEAPPIPLRCWVTLSAEFDTHVMIVRRWSRVPYPKLALGHGRMAPLLTDAKNWGITERLELMKYIADER